MERLLVGCRAREASTLGLSTDGIVRLGAQLSPASPVLWVASWPFLWSRVVARRIMRWAAAIEEEMEKNKDGKEPPLGPGGGHPHLQHLSLEASGDGRRRGARRRSTLDREARPPRGGRIGGLRSRPNLGGASHENPRREVAYSGVFAVVERVPGVNVCASGGKGQRLEFGLCKGVKSNK